jgi:hypothetical protein
MSHHHPCGSEKLDHRHHRPWSRLARRQRQPTPPPKVPIEEEMQDVDHLRSRAPPHHLGGTKPATSTMEGAATAPAIATVASPQTRTSCGAAAPPGATVAAARLRPPPHNQTELLLCAAPDPAMEPPDPEGAPLAVAENGPRRRATPSNPSSRAHPNPPERRGGRPHRHLPRDCAGSWRPARAVAQRDAGSGG